MTDRISAKEYKSLQKKTRSKYGNKRTTVDGISFDSKREAEHWSLLKVREKAGEITKLERQAKYSLDVNGVHICNYIADMVYFDNTDGRTHVVDVKGHVTPEFKLKAKIMKAIYGIEIEIVK